MARTRLQRCTACGGYGLGEECKKCGEKMTTVAPLKYSPQDSQGARRRQREDAGSEELNRFQLPGKKVRRNE